MAGIETTAVSDSPGTSDGRDRYAEYIPAAFDFSLPLFGCEFHRRCACFYSFRN